MLLIRQILLYVFIGLLFSSCKHIYLVDSEMIGIAETAETKSLKIDSIILPYKIQLDNGLDSVIGYSQFQMNNGFPNGLLGNFIADLLLESISSKYQLENAFVLINNGGLRRYLPEGKITKRTIFELMPFENEIVILSVDSGTIQQITRTLIFGDEMSVAGCKAIFDDTLLKSFQINNEEWNPSVIYHLITIDYLANGGSGLHYLKSVEKRIVTSIKFRDQIMEYIEQESLKGNKLKAVQDVRIQIN